MSYLNILLKLTITSLAFFVLTAGVKKLIAEPVFSRIFPKNIYKIPQGIFIAVFQLLLYFVACIYVLKTPFIGAGFIKSLVLGIVIGASLILISIVLTKYMNIFTFSKNKDYVDSNHIISFLTALVFFLVMALFEEILFRGIIYTLVRAEFGMIVSILIVTCLFIVPHLFNKGISIMSIVSLIFAGLILNYMREISGSIWMPFGFHFAWNFVQGYLGFNVSGGNEITAVYNVKGQKRNLLTGGKFGIEASLVTNIVLFSGLIGAVLIFG